MNRPVTVTNVACELFKRVAQEALYDLYGVECEIKDTSNLSTYLWAFQTDCEFHDKLRCLVDRLPANNLPCTSRSRTTICDIDVEEEIKITCASSIVVTVGAIAISDNNS